MNVGELFVSLGVKGADQSAKAVDGVRKGLGEVRSMSLEAKAAIIGVVYGLERLMSNSAKTGTDLSNFNALTGLSTKNLQQWQYAARQAGISSEEFTGSIKGVQQSMTNMMLGKGAPEGMAMLANKVGFDPKRARDTFYVMEQLQKFAKTVPPDVANAMIKSFGVSEGTIAAMRKGVFNPEMFKRAPVYSDKEVNQLSKVDVAWSNLGTKIQMAMGHFTSKHGMQLVKDVTVLVDLMVKLAETLVTIGEKLKVFEVFKDTIKLINESLTGVVSLMGGDVKAREIGGAIGSLFTKDFTSKNSKDSEAKYQQQLLNRISPKVNAPNSSQNVNNHDVTMNLNFNHDGKDAHKTGASVHKSIKDAYRQIGAQNQGN